MALNKAIVTPAESDVVLSSFADWVALTDDIKAVHIAKASVHMQTKWTCSDVDWSDGDTIPDDIKEACCYFALADYVGNLYSDPSVVASGEGRVTETSDTVGPLKTAVKFEHGSWSDTANARRSYANDLMGVYCTRKTSGAVWAERT